MIPNALQTCPSTGHKNQSFINTHNQTLTRLVLGYNLHHCPRSRSLSLSKLHEHSLLQQLCMALYSSMLISFTVITSCTVSILQNLLSPTCLDRIELHGCLIDLHHIVDYKTYQGSGAADRKGTYPYIAIKILDCSEYHRY